MNKGKAFDSCQKIATKSLLKNETIRLRGNGNLNFDPDEFAYLANMETRLVIPNC